MKKRTISILLMVCMLLAILPVKTSAARGDIFTVEITVGGKEVECTFKVLFEPSGSKHGSVQIGDGSAAAIPTDTAGVFEIPAQVEREKDGQVLIYDVTDIGNSAFKNCSGLTGNLIIPSEVTYISSSAFKNCSGLTGNLIIPDSVTNIGDDAFFGCSGFDGTLTIGSKVKTIGYSAFSGCSGLTGNLIIPDLVTTIYESAFSGCSGFDGYLSIRGNVQTIAYGTFQDCSKLKGDLIIPDSVTIINNYAFSGCSGFDGSLSIGRNVNTIAIYAFNGCSSLTGDLTIPDSVTKIGNFAFRNCRGFNGNLTIGDKVETIGECAFNDCSGFEGRLKLGANVKTIGNYAFSGCSKLSGELTIPDSVTSIGVSAFSGCRGFDGTLTIGDKVETIGEYAFYNCRGFTGSLSIGANVKTIGNSAFRGCSGFDGTLTIGDKVETIGASAFNGCSSLTGDLAIPNSVTTIWNNAFSGCSGFDGTLTIGANVETIGTLAFSGCSPDSVIFLGTTAPSVASDSFSGTYPIYYPSGGTGYNTGGWTSYSGRMVCDITIATITGVTIPVTGATPDMTVDETTQYTATISWTPADTTFKGSTVYTATITIMPKKGYTLKGVPADFFTVAGAVTTNEADSGVVTAVFPETDANAVAPTINTHPSDVTILEGNAATFEVSASASDGGILTYQWQRSIDNGANWTDISGATSANYTTGVLTAGDSGSKYRCIVTNTKNSTTATTTSNEATLTVNAVAVAPTINTHPSNATILEGNTAAFEVSASALDGGTLSYQWQKSTDNGASWSNIAGATSASYTTGVLTTGDSGSKYRCIVTNTKNSTTATATSNAATLTVNAFAVAPTIDTNPSDVTILEGNTATFEVSAIASDGGTLSYQWQKSTDNGASWSDIAGATSASYTTGVLTTGDSGSKYRCIVTNTKNTTTAIATSNAATLTVNELTNAETPTITAQPEGKTVSIGDTATLSITATVPAGGTITYQWYSNTTNSNNGGTIIEGATSSTYTAPTSTAGTTYYYCVVTNTDNSKTGTKTASTTSSAVAVQVNELTNAEAPTITAQPEGKTVSVGGTAILSITATVPAGGTITYQWYKNTSNSNNGGSIIEGATSSTYTAPTSTAGTTYYYCVVTNTDNSKTGTKVASTTSSAVAVQVNTIIKKEEKPNAAFTATGPDTGTLSGVTSGMKYKINNGEWININTDTVNLTGLSACTITIVRKGNGTTTIDSDEQIITVTKAATPSVTKRDCTTIANNDGKLIGVTAAMEYKLSSASNWTSGTGSDITGLTSGTYYVRVKANSTTLASDMQIITIAVYSAPTTGGGIIITQESTPNATFTATGPDTGTLSGVTNGMKYRIGNGSWIDITSGSDISLTGLTACTISVVRKGNGFTTTDSIAQTITVSKAAMPTTIKSDCTTIANNDGKLIGITAAMEYKLSTASSWASGTGSEITGLASGTYYVRVKANGATLASDAQIITIDAYIAPVTEIQNGDSITSTDLDKLISSGETLTVEGDNGAKIVFDTEALKGIGEQTSGEIKVEMKDVSSEYQEKFPGKQVFSLMVSSGNDTILSSGGSVTVSLPYELNEAESTQDVTVWYLASDGTMTEIPGTYDPVMNIVTFTVTNFDIYAVGVAEPDPGLDPEPETEPEPEQEPESWINPFNDVKEKDWFYEAVRFTNQNGLFAGTSSNTFSPSIPMTRAMFWTALGRLDGNNFSGSGAFDAARIWAMNAGITDGTNPNNNITREQMISILWRYAGSPKSEANLIKFSDADSVSNYAVEAIVWAVENGIIVGMDGALRPKDNATRAQAAAILQRFIEVMQSR